MNSVLRKVFKIKSIKLINFTFFFKPKVSPIIIFIIKIFEFWFQTIREKNIFQRKSYKIDTNIQEQDQKEIYEIKNANS